MAIQAVKLLRLGAIAPTVVNPCCSVMAKRALLVLPERRLYHSSPALHNDVFAQSTQAQRSPGNNPIEASMAQSASPTGNTTTATADDDAKHAAFLGEADSDDGFEADVEINPEAHRHRFDDVNASGLHGQAGEGDEPIERERRAQEAMDASQAAYLGEADSDEAHEADREANPKNYRHRIEDASQSAYLGEADSDDAHEADREANPEKYRHRIEETGSSGLHGQSGEGDDRFEK